MSVKKHFLSHYHFGISTSFVTFYSNHERSCGETL
jgi:hypothetical protein